MAHLDQERILAREMAVHEDLVGRPIRGGQDDRLVDDERIPFADRFDSQNRRIRRGHMVLDDFDEGVEFGGGIRLVLRTTGGQTRRMIEDGFACVKIKVLWIQLISVCSVRAVMLRHLVFTLHPCVTRTVRAARGQT